MKKHKKNTGSEYIGRSRTLRGIKMEKPACDERGHRYAILKKPRRNQPCTTCCKNLRVRVVARPVNWTTRDMEKLNLFSVERGSNNPYGVKRVPGATLNPIDMALPPVHVNDATLGALVGLREKWDGFPMTNEAGDTIGTVTDMGQDADGNLVVSGVLNEAGIKAVRIGPDVKDEGIESLLDKVFGSTTENTVVVAPAPKRYTLVDIQRLRKAELHAILDKLNVPFLVKDTNPVLIQRILDAQEEAE